MILAKAYTEMTLMNMLQPILKLQTIFVLYINQITHANWSSIMISHSKYQELIYNYMKN